MGKRRRQSGRKKPTDDDGDDAYSKMKEPDQDSDGYFNDEIEAFASKDEKILLDQDGADSTDESYYIDDDEDEIMKLDSDESELEDGDDKETIEIEEKQESEDEEDFLMGEDDTDEEAGLPSQKAWGRKKKEFYDSNLQDADHFENEEEEELVAEEEEKEAMALQQRMALHLDQEDFDFFEPEEKEENEESNVIETEEETHIVQDLQKLSKEEKIQLLMKESPELFVLLDDYEEKMNEVIEKYHPLLLIARKGSKISQEGRDFIEVMHQLLLNYCLNISFYLWLKAKRESVKDHPVIEKIVEYRNLLSKVEPLLKNVEKEITMLLKTKTESDETSSVSQEPRSKQKDVKTLASKAKSMHTVISRSKPKGGKPTKKGAKKNQNKDESMPDPWEYYNNVAQKRKDERERMKDAFETQISAQDEENNDEDADGKRAITYEMAKNKGLIRKRKKENRNPRVKHKMKFKKAVVKRKSQVPTVRNEAVNYGGELTGIKSRVVKSIKIK